MRFSNIGTDKIGVGICNKMGSQSLHALLTSQQIYQSTGIKIENANDKKYVILLRDSFDKWESGYWQEIQMLYPEWLEHDTEFEVGAIDEAHNTGIISKSLLNVMWKMHDPMNSLYYTFHEDPDKQIATPWMYHGHGEFWIWNSADELSSLGVYAQLPTIYFLELKDLSNPKFLEWLKEQDEDWESVIKIPHKNQSTDFATRKIIQQFWFEYNEGLILQDKVLVSPLSKKYPPKLIIRILEQEQELIDFIRKNHERYLRFD